MALSEILVAGRVVSTGLFSVLAVSVAFSVLRLPIYPKISIPIIISGITPMVIISTILFLKNSILFYKFNENGSEFPSSVICALAAWILSSCSGSEVII